MTKPRIEFRPVAEPGWRVLEYMIQLGEVPHTYQLAGWIVEDGQIVPDWEQSYPAYPYLQRAVNDPERGLVHIVLAPGEEEWPQSRVAPHIADAMNEWETDRSIAGKLGLSVKDAQALAHAGMARYEEYLAVPPWERDAGGFYVWLLRQEATRP